MKSLKALCHYKKGGVFTQKNFLDAIEDLEYINYLFDEKEKTLEDLTPMLKKIWQNILFCEDKELEDYANFLEHKRCIEYIEHASKVIKKIAPKSNATAIITIEEKGLVDKNGNCGRNIKEIASVIYNTTGEIHIKDLRLFTKKDGTYYKDNYLEKIITSVKKDLF